MDKIFQALADPTRRTILKKLKIGEMNAGEIARLFDMSKPSITHHLNILKNANLVRSEKHGQYVVYTLNLTVLQDALSEFYEFTQ
ncbi:MAG: autorepressor SdpR family transcription factor [Turicibacter sp.]|nr:autorepressor SdpR family transcription factor [Turicibacter sp.]